MSLDWLEAYCIGDAKIDHQHQYLFRIANDCLLAASKDERVRHAMLIVDYTVWHFAYEEDLMRRCNFPGYNEHLASHLKLISRLNDLTDQLRTYP